MGKRYRAKKDPDPLAPGWYDARFVKHTEDEGDYGPFIEWEFRARNGAENQTVKMRSSANFGTKSREYRFVEGLMGRGLRFKDGESEDFDIEDLWGRSCRIRVGTKETKSGVFNTVEEIKPLAEVKADGNPAAEEDVAG
jgi:hypothetical protein